VAGQACQSETRVCTNGVLSGSLLYGACEVTLPPLNQPDPTIQSIALQNYWPTQLTYSESRLVRHDGFLYFINVFYPAGGLQPFYDQTMKSGVPGKTYVKEQRWNYLAKAVPQPYWETMYNPPTARTCLTEYDFWHFGDDGSIVEAGSYANPDMRPADGCEIPAGGSSYWDYTTGQLSGLGMSGPGLLTKGIPHKNFNVTNSSPALVAAGNHKFKLFSDSRLINVYPRFQPAYGRSAQGVWAKGNGKIYENVAHIIFYHGGEPHPMQITTSDKLYACSNVQSLNPDASKYVNFPGYNAYASEYYLAPGKGVIQTSFLYSESDAFQGPHCTKGTVFVTGSTVEEIKSKLELEALYVDER
jgi:hypothetical protein